MKNSFKVDFSSPKLRKNFMVHVLVSLVGLAILATILLPQKLTARRLAIA